MRRWTIVAIWLVAAGVSLLIAWQTAVGPVVLVLQKGHHGVHLGDLVGVGASSTWAWCTTRGIQARDRRTGGPRPRTPASGS